MKDIRQLDGTDSQKQKGTVYFDRSFSSYAADA